MRTTRTLLFGLALVCAAAVPLPAASLWPFSSSGAVTAGRRYLLPRGTFIALNQAALQQFLAANRRHDLDALRGLIRRNELQKLMRDAVVVVARAPGPSDPGVEVQIPGFIGTVVAQRPNLTAR
jgi:hypothetical protein